MPNPTPHSRRLPAAAAACLTAIALIAGARAAQAQDMAQNVPQQGMTQTAQQMSNTAPPMSNTAPPMPTVVMPRQSDADLVVQPALRPDPVPLTLYKRKNPPGSALTQPMHLDYINRLGGLDLQVTYPDDAKVHPVIIWADRVSSVATPLLQDLARNGYIVIQPQDSVNGSEPTPEHPLKTGGFTDFAPVEMSHIMSHLDDVAAALPALRGRIDSTRVGAGGYTFGTDTRAQLSGMNLVPLNNNKAPSPDFPHALAFAILAPENSGKEFPLIPASELGAPVLYVTGDKPDITTRLPKGATYVLYMAGARNGIAPAPQDPQAAESGPSPDLMFNAVGAYYDALVMHDPVAADYLSHNILWAQSQGSVYLGAVQDFVPAVPPPPAPTVEPDMLAPDALQSPAPQSAAPQDGAAQ